MQGASSRLVVETLTRAHRAAAYVYVRNASRGWAGAADLKAALPPQSVVVTPSTASNNGGWPHALGAPQLHANWAVKGFLPRQKKKE